MSELTEARKCGRCMMVENTLSEFDLSASEVSRLRAGETVMVAVDQALYERIRGLLEK